MTSEQPGTGTGRAGWPTDPDDDLDRAFGPDSRSVPLPDRGQRVRRRVWVGIGSVATAAVLATVLVVIVGSVQNGVGGIFPRPDVASDRFVDRARSVPGVATVDADDPTKTSFASYDVAATVTAGPGMDGSADHDARAALLSGLSGAAGDASGNGVTVSAVADLGALEVGVTASDEATAARLRLAEQLRAIGGVQEVRCAWSTTGPSDDPSDQEVVLQTAGRGDALGAIRAKAQTMTEAVFPGATVTADGP